MPDQTQVVPPNRWRVSHWRRACRKALALTGAAVMLSVAAVVPVVAGPAGAAHAQSSQAADCALPGPSGWALREHVGLDTDYNGRWRDPVGTTRAIALFVDFPDVAGSAADVPALTNRFAPASAWFDTSSYGRTDLDITWDTQWRRMPAPSVQYHNNSATLEDHHFFMQHAVTAADPYVDFTGYDFVYVIVPPALFNSHFRSAAFIAHADNSHHHLDSEEGSIRLGASLGDGSDHNHRLLVHETSHLFGLPDLYHYTASNDDDRYRAVGGWDLMGAIWGSAPDHFAWHKWKLGWVDDAQVYCLANSQSQVTWTLNALHSTAGPKLAVIRTGFNRAVVVEYRSAHGPFDGVWGQTAQPGCFQHGVLVYTVDGDVLGGADPIEVLDANPGTNSGTGCSPELRQLDTATMMTYGQEVVDPVSGVRVRLTDFGWDTRTVQVTWP